MYPRMSLSLHSLTDEKYSVSFIRAQDKLRNHRLIKPCLPRFYRTVIFMLLSKQNPCLYANTDTGFRELHLQPISRISKGGVPVFLIFRWRDFFITHHSWSYSKIQIPCLYGNTDKGSWKMHLQPISRISRGRYSGFPYFQKKGFLSIL